MGVFTPQKEVNTTNPKAFALGELVLNISTPLLVTHSRSLAGKKRPRKGTYLLLGCPVCLDPGVTPWPGLRYFNSLSLLLESNCKSEVSHEFFLGESV